MALLGLAVAAARRRVGATRGVARSGRGNASPLRWAILSAALLAVLLWASCGGGGMNFNSGGTPAGNFTLTLTGTYSNPTGTGPATLTNSTTVGLRVN
jgi:hypothetical protein